MKRLGTEMDYDWFHFDLQGSTDFGSGMPYYQHFYLGGLHALSGYHVQRLHGRAYGLANVGWLHRLSGSDLPFASKTYLGLWFDAGNVWLDSQDAAFDDLIYNGAITLLLETPLGRCIWVMVGPPLRDRVGLPGGDMSVDSWAGGGPGIVGRYRRLRDQFSDRME